MTAIGFIGLGNMGGPMALNLVKAGHELTVFDLSKEAVDTLVAAGAKAAATAGDAAKGAEAVVTMLPAGPHVESVYLGKDGLLAQAGKGTLFIDSSTIDVPTARKVIGLAREAGMEMVDAPVSGGVGGASAGTLAVMFSGPQADFEDLADELKVIGKPFYIGPDAGLAQTMKLVNNMLVAAHVVGSMPVWVATVRVLLTTTTVEPSAKPAERERDQQRDQRADDRDIESPATGDAA